MFVQGIANILLIEQLSKNCVLHGLYSVRLARKIHLVFLLHDEKLLVHIALLRQAFLRLVPAVLAALH